MVNTITCRLCGNEAKHKCSGCLSVSYCSKEHQKLDWKTHKSNCSAFEVLKDSELGRCLVAKRDIRPGEVVLKEKPLVSGPPQVTGPVCLGCHNELTEPVVTCERCGWPLCSLQCSNSPHHKPECQWALVKRKQKLTVSLYYMN